MKYRVFRRENVCKKLVCIFTASALMLSGYFNLSGVAAPEQAEKTFNGITNADVILNNIDYSDVKGSGTWAAEAIYETGALDIIKGYGDRRFGRTDIVTKEQAIAIAYRVAGREADAQKAAELLNSSRTEEEKKRNPLSMWSDGYLKLAADDGLISAKDFSDALNTDQADIEPGGFYRGAPAQRQEMAFWLAKALGLEPEYQQQTVFNSYRDWKSSDPEKIPYIEAILKNQIMNGNGNGYFNPLQSVTREQSAQIVKNSSSYMLKALKYEKNTGTLENIELSRTIMDGQRFETAVLGIRNINGKLHKINIGFINDPAHSGKNEQDGQELSPLVLDLVVYKNGVPAKSSVLEKGDRIEYITAEDNTVKYVKVFSSTTDTQYIAAQVKSINSEKSTIDILPFFTLQTPDIALAQKYISFGSGSGTPLDSYIYSNNADVRIDGRAADIKSLEPDMYVVLTVVNDMVTGVETFDLSKIREEERGVVSGMVEENNAQLGYIALYREDGTGTAPGAAQAEYLRTYYYSGKNGVEVYRNHKKAGIDDITAGDSVFLKLDDSGNVIAASAVSNYTVRYGNIISRSPASIAVEYEDGLQQVLDIHDNTIITSDGKIAGYSALKDGDRVKLVLQETNNITRVKEISRANSGGIISNIYKGIVSYIDEVSDSVVLQNIEVLDGDRWVRADKKGFTNIRLGDRYDIYSANRMIDTEGVNKYLKNSPAYIAVEKDYGGEEKVVVLSFRNEKDAELPVVYDDRISGMGSGQFTLYKENKRVSYLDGTIVVKDGRLVSGNSIKADDEAYVVASRGSSGGDLYAGIVKIEEKFAPNTFQVYRGEIQKIDANRAFTVKSFSELNGLKWDFWNTPKTFTINYDTRILGDDGVVNPREFVGYGEDSYIGQKVFIIAKDGEAMLISTAPFSNPFNVKGEIYQAGDNSELKLWNAKIYDSYNLVWKDSNEITLTVLQNSVIIKNNNIVNASELKKGDRIRAVKRDNTTAGDAYIIFVEG